MKQERKVHFEKINLQKTYCRAVSSQSDTWTSSSTLAILTPWPSQRRRNLNLFPHLITTIFIKLLICTRSILGMERGYKSFEQNGKSYRILILLGKGIEMIFTDIIVVCTVSNYCHNVSNDPCAVKSQWHVLMDFKSCYTQKEALFI